MARPLRRRALTGAMFPAPRERLSAAASGMWRSTSVAETYDDIRDDIKEQRGELAGNIRRFEATAKRSLDVRRLLEERPLDVAIIALGAGLFLSNLLRRTDRRPTPEYREMTETFGAIGEALMGVGKQQAGALVQSAKDGMRARNP
jgi:hypothetical protein